MTSQLRIEVSLLSGLLFLVASVGGASALDPSDKCLSSKLKVAGKYAFCRLKAESKGVKKSTPPDYTKCDAKFAAKWSSIEAKAAGACPVTGDEAAVASIVAADTGLVAGTVSASPRFLNNGNGTISDVGTGLTWEVKSYLDSSIHDIAQGYSWADAFSVHVATLNGSSFGGHDDWRVPSPMEMLSLINFGSAADVRGFAEFDVGCLTGCDVLTCSCAFAQVWGGDRLWTDRTNPEDSSEAVAIRNDIGEVVEREESKNTSHPVIAVRGGRNSD